MNKDWGCVNCNYHNFSKNIVCRKCGSQFDKNQETPIRLGEAQSMTKPARFLGNDWHCIQCNYRNFADNKTCRRCLSEK